MSDWFELHVEGARSAVEAFLETLPEESAFDAEALEAEHESLGEKMREAIGLRTDHTLYAAVAAVEALERRIADGAELAIEARRGFASAEFEFRIETPSRDAAVELRRTLAGWEGVEVEDFRESKEIDRESRGVEVYTPVHDFEYRATGRLSGPPA